MQIKPWGPSRKEAEASSSWCGARENRQFQTRASTELSLEAKQSPLLWKQSPAVTHLNLGSDLAKLQGLTGLIRNTAEQSDLVEDVPAHGRGAGTRWSLRSLPTQTTLWFYKPRPHQSAGYGKSTRQAERSRWPFLQKCSFSVT